MNGGHKAPGVYIDLQEIKRITRRGMKIVYRLDGARYKYNKSKSQMDELQLAAAGMADHIVFQSEECVRTFRELGYEGNNYSIIYNGVDGNRFNMEGKNFWDGKFPLKIFSSNWSSNIHKGYRTIADFSEEMRVKSEFVGNWNESTPKKKVNVLPPQKQEQLAQLYKAHDVFLHPAEHDPCPNVVVEAMSCGLPVIYHNSGGTPEIAGNYGIALPTVINPSSIANTINEMTHRYRDLVKRIQTDKQKFTMAAVAEQYLAILKQILANE